MIKLWLIWENRAGELDRIPSNVQNSADDLYEMILGNELHAGDVIRIITREDTP